MSLLLCLCFFWDYTRNDYLLRTISMRFCSAWFVFVMQSPGNYLFHFIQDKSLHYHIDCIVHPKGCVQTQPVRQKPQQNKQNGNWLRIWGQVLRLNSLWPSDAIWITLQWRHNDHDSVSNHQPHGRLFNRLFRRRSKKTSKLRVTGLCVGNSPGPVNSPHKGPVTRKMLPFDDVIMINK